MDRRHLPESFQGRRLCCERMREVDAETLTLIESQPERFFAYMPPDPGLRGPALARHLTAAVTRLWRDQQEYAYVLVDRETQRTIGHLSVHALAWNHDRCELAYWVRCEAEGRGYASEAVSAAERVLFESGFHRIEIRCDARNRSSALVAERCGYQLEGTLRQHIRRADGTYRDSLVYGKLNPR